MIECGLYYAAISNQAKKSQNPEVLAIGERLGKRSQALGKFAAGFASNKGFEMPRVRRIMERAKENVLERSEDLTGMLDYYTEPCERVVKASRIEQQER